jgi:hypothetical protein
MLFLSVSWAGKWAKIRAKKDLELTIAEAVYCNCKYSNSLHEQE